MITIKLKQKITLGLSSLLVLGSILATMPIAQADYNPVPRNACSLAVFPFNIAGPELLGSAGNPFINKINSVCEDFVDYPNPYSPQPPEEEDNPYRSGAAGKHVPISKHIHTYFNDSVEDDYYYGAFMDRFEITLENDAFNSIKIDDITCGTPIPEGYDNDNLAPINDCSGTVSDLWGGTTVGKRTVGSNIIVTWDFAQTNQDGNFVGRPIIWGNNGSDFGGQNLTDEDNRKLGFYVNLESENNDTIWSATTSSRTLIAHRGIKKTNYPENENNGCVDNDINDPDSGWCYLPSPDDYPTETVRTTSDRTFHWFPIGSVATVWREEVEEEEQPVCEELLVDHQDPIYNNTLSQFKANAFDNNGDLFPGKIRYYTDPGHGYFYTERPDNVEENPSEMVYENFNFILPNPMGNPAFDFGFNSILALNFDFPDTNPIIQPDLSDLSIIDFGDLTLLRESIEVDPGTNVYFFARETGENIVNIKAVNAGPGLCRRDFDITPYEICKELKVNYNESIFQQKVSAFEAKSLNIEGGNFGGKITYEVDEGYGAFYLRPPSDMPLNASPVVEEFDASEAVAEPDGGFCGIDNSERSQEQYIFNSIPGSSILQLDTSSIINLSTGYATGNFSGLTNTSDFGAYNFSSKKSGAANTLLAFNAIDLEIDLSNTDISILEGLLSPNRAYQSLTVDPGTKVYFWGEEAGEDKVHIKTACTNEDDCERDFDITPSSGQVCASMDITFHPAEPFRAGQTITFDLNGAVDTNGNPLPLETRIFWQTRDTGGTLTSGTNVSDENGEFVLTLADTPVVFNGSTSPGTIKVGVSTSDPAYSSDCHRKFYIGEELICTDLDSSLTFLGEPEELDSIEKNQLYQTRADATYIPEFENTINYSVNSDYGTFINTLDLSPFSPVITVLRALQAAEEINPESLMFFLGTDALVSSGTIAENENVLLATYSQNLPAISDVLSINASDFHNTECQRFVPYTVTGGQCETLQINTLEGQFDPTAEFTVLNITGDFNQHPGDIVVTTSEGSLSKFAEEIYSSTITYSQTEVANSNNSLTVLYRGAENLSGNLVTITVNAVGNPICSDTLSNVPVGEVVCIDLDIIEPDRPWEVDEDSDNNQLFQIDVQTNPAGRAADLYYTWQIENDGHFASNNSDEINGQLGATNVTVEDFSENTLVEVWAQYSATGERINTCYDFINARGEEEENPEIEKFVFPENDIDERDDIINIGESSDTQYVTYLIRFTPGKVKSVEITEERLQNSRINGSISGDLDFEAMRINVLEEGETQGYTILKTAGYQDDDDDDNYDENGNDSNLDEYEDDYRCEDNSDNLCIEGDFGDVVSDFKNGREIKFRNLDEVGPNGKIFIKYQMENNSVIDQERCQTLTAANGCGEEFKNEVSFTAYSENDFEGEEFEDSDSAIVIVICPFILTRSGGDVFFHDIIDTGVDVAQCSRVKGHEGPGVTPTPERPPIAPSTGPGDLPEALRLTLPSHDVCRYSNISSNIEGYNDVLKHFSSTICELRADVAEIWTEKNINEAIAANITRISRFGETLSQGTIMNISDLGGAKNKQSGVFIRIDHDLTIGGGLGEYVIQGSEEIPAAQTYIVKGADLYINSNIEYGITDFDNPNTIPSAAFIVIDGNIIISNDIKKIDGILMAVDLDGNGDGQIKSNPDSKTSNKLTINGNLIGNVYNLFKNRIGVGDPTKDEASITIHYDERILLNTPPGINELIDIEQAIVPN